MSSCDKKIESGSDVIHLMKDSYNNSYLKNFTFSQYITEYKNDTVINKTIWHEAYSCPNKLVIKIDSFNSGNGYIFNQDTFFIMKNNMVDKKHRDIHDLLLLGFDIYAQPFQTSFEKLTEKGYDLSKVCETKINGREAYCIGVNNITDKENNFYIDKENLCFIKMVSYTHSRYNEAIFADYKIVKGKYIATKVLFYNKSQLIMSEEYFNMDFPEFLDSRIFNAEYFKEAIW